MNMDVTNYSTDELLKHAFQPVFGNKNPNYCDIVIACRREVKKRLDTLNTKEGK